MKIDIAAPHFSLTEGLREHVESRFGPLERFHDRPMTTTVLLDRSTAHRDRPYLVKAHAKLVRQTTHVTARSGELYAAIDAAAEKLEAKLRKAHEHRGRRRHATRAGAATV